MFNAFISFFVQSLVLDYLIYKRLGKKFKWLRNTKKAETITKELLLDVNDSWWNAHELKSEMSHLSVTPVTISGAPVISDQQNSYSNRAFVDDGTSSDTQF